MEGMVTEVLPNGNFRVDINGHTILAYTSGNIRRNKIKIIEDAIKNRLTLNITYLKAKDEKSSRLIQPTYIGEMLYLGKTYTGIQAFCLKRRENRVFKVDRILAISYHSEN